MGGGCVRKTCASYWALTTRSNPHVFGDPRLLKTVAVVNAKLLYGVNIT